MELSVSHSLYTKISKKSNIQKITPRYWNIFKKTCDYNGVEIIEAQACPDHIHMLVKIPPKISVSSFMGYLKGKSSLMIFEEHANLKYNYGNRHFWAEAYYVITVGLNKIQLKDIYKIKTQKIR